VDSGDAEVGDLSVVPSRTSPVASRAASRRRRSSGVSGIVGVEEGTGHLVGKPSGLRLATGVLAEVERRTLYLSTTPNGGEVSEEEQNGSYIPTACAPDMNYGTEEYRGDAPF
jgi:hypothetical protein